MTAGGVESPEIGLVQAAKYRFPAADHAPELHVQVKVQPLGVVNVVGGVGGSWLNWTST